MGATKKKRKKIDWDSVEKEWRTGQFSNIVLGKKYGCSDVAIGKKAREKGWKKDLVDEYQKGIEEELVRIGSDFSSDSEPKNEEQIEDDKQIVSDAVKVGVEVVRSHRKRLRNLTELSDNITERLRDSLIDGDLERVLSISSPHESHTDILGKLSRIVSETVKLERQAFNLDKKEEKKGTVNNDVEDRIRAHMKKNGYQP